MKKFILSFLISVVMSSVIANLLDIPIPVAEIVEIVVSIGKIFGWVVVIGLVLALSALGGNNTSVDSESGSCYYDYDNLGRRD